MTERVSLPAGYRIVELSDRNEAIDGAKEIRAFDSAYAGMEMLRTALLRNVRAARNWCMVDQRGRVILRPDDVDCSAA